MGADTMQLRNWLKTLIVASSSVISGQGGRTGRSRTSRSRTPRGQTTNQSCVQSLEDRCLLSAAHDVVQLTALRADPAFSAIDGRLESGQRIGVAVIDTGVLATHRDLRSSFLVYVDGFQQATSTQISDAQDPGGHGTHVAGIVLGGFSSTLGETVGVAPEAGLVAMNGLSRTANGTTDAVLWNLNWVLQNHQRYNVKVVNMSLGTSIEAGESYVKNFNSLPRANDYFRVIQQLEAVGVTVVTASGNSYVHFNSAGQSHPAVFSTLSVGNTLATANGPYLAGDGLPQTAELGVDATPNVDEFNVGSQRSTMANQIAAPGTDITSTWNDGSYNKIGGTSMASPMVAGLVALMQDAAVTFGGRYLTVSEVYSIITSTADIIVDTPDPNSRKGSVQQVRSVLDGQSPFNALEDLAETGQSFRRINAKNAIEAVRTLVQTRGGGQNSGADTNNTISSAVEFPALNGLHAYQTTTRIGTDGDKAVGRRDVDLFKVVLETGGQIDFLTSPRNGGDNFDLYLRLFNSQGTEIASDDNSGPGAYALLRSPVLPTGTYYVGISNSNNRNYNPANGSNAVNSGPQGDYELIVGTVNPDPNGVVQGAAPVDLTSPNFVFPAGHPARDAGIFVANKVGSFIGSDPHPLHETDPDRYDERIPVGATDVDMFSIVAPDNGTLYVDIQSKSVYGVDGVDSFVRVYQQNPNGSLTMVGENDDRAVGNPDSFVAVNVAIGRTYFVALTTYGNQVFNPTNPAGRSSASNEIGLMDAYFSFSNGDVNATAYAETNLNAVATGGIGSFPGVIGADFGNPLSGANNGFKDVDFLAITPDQTGAFEVSVTSPDNTLNSSLGIWRLNEAKTDIVQVIVSSGASSVARFSATQGETFWISITGQGNEGFNWAAPASGTGGDVGNYTLTTAFLTNQEFRSFSDNSINVNLPTPIDFGQTIRAAIGRDGDTAVGAADLDIYSFTATETRKVRIRASSGGIERSADTFLRVFDAAGTEISFNDNEHSLTRDAAVIVNVIAGRTYYIGVNGSSADARKYNPLTGARAAAGSQGAYSVTVAAATPEILQFSGTTGNDKFYLTYSGTGPNMIVTVSLSSNGGAKSNLGTFPGTSRLSLNGRAGSDSVQVSGRAGNDVFTIASAKSLRFGPSIISLNSIEAKTLVGRAGNDIYKFTTNQAVGQVSLNESGGGTDTIDLSAVTSNTKLNLGVASWQTVNSRIRLNLTSGANFENVIGGSGNDILTGNGRANRLTGNAGNDRLTGNAGNDVLDGGKGNDTYVFGIATAAEVDTVIEATAAGIDTLHFGALKTAVKLNLGNANIQQVHANRRLKLNSGVSIENAIGGSGNDNLTGNSRGNQLTGNGGGDRLTGNAGNDQLTGNAGNDVLVGGTGNDTYFFGVASRLESDTVTEAANAGIDTLNFASLKTAVNLNLASNTSLLIHRNRNLKLNSGSTFENVVGGSGSDLLRGNSLANTLNGNNGHDILIGNAGKDRLRGGAGRDILIGGLNSDDLNGGSSDDILIPGRTASDNAIAQLNKLRTEWISTTPYTTRVAHLRAGVGGTPKSSLKANDTVLGDSKRDTLKGSTGRDWYFKAVDDVITGLLTSELVDSL